jgi:hypothetical protein
MSLGDTTIQSLTHPIQLTKCVPVHFLVWLCLFFTEEKLKGGGATGLPRHVLTHRWQVGGPGCPQAWLHGLHMAWVSPVGRGVLGF